MNNFDLKFLVGYEEYNQHGWIYFRTIAAFELKEDARLFLEARRPKQGDMYRRNMIKEMKVVIE